MKVRKLLALLVAIAVMVTMLPAAALAQDASFTIRANNITVVKGDKFEWAITTQGSFPDAENGNGVGGDNYYSSSVENEKGEENNLKEHSSEDDAARVRFYAVVPNLKAGDITLYPVSGGTPEVVSNKEEREHIGATEKDLVLAWGSEGGFPLHPNDYSEGVTTTFKAAINKVGKYEVRFVFWKFGTGDEEGEQINGFDDGATITVVEGAVTGRIYPSNDEFDADGRDEVELTIYLADRYGNLTSNIGSGKAVYVWAEREEDEISVVDFCRGIENGKKLYEEDSLVVIDPQKDIITVKYASIYAGEVHFCFGIDTYNAENPPGYTGKDTPRTAASCTIEYKADTDEYEIKLVGSESDYVGKNAEAADGISPHEVEFRVTDSLGFPVKGERVNFDTNSSRLVLNKDYAVSNSSGIVKVKATSSRSGTYRLYAELDSNRKIEFIDSDGDEGLALEYRPSAAYDISVKKGDGAVVALDESYTFEFAVYDIFGRLIKEGDYTGSDRLIDTITVPVCPDDARIEDIDDFLKDDPKAVSWDNNLKVEIDGRYLNKEGNYALRVRLHSGRYATAEFKVREQGRIVDMTIEYDPDYIVENETSNVPEVKLIDEDGIEADASRRDLEFSVSNTRLARIDSEGRVTARRGAEGVVVVTAVNTRHNVIATTEVRIGDIGASGIKFDVPKVLLVDEEYTIGMKVVDDDGREYLKDAEYNVVVLSKPPGADVEVDVFDDEFTIISDTKGDVTLIATAREDDEAISCTLTLEFVTVPEDDGAGDVFLTIGGTFAYVNGSPVGLDAPAFIDQGRTYVPVRFLAETFGAEADWTPKNGPVKTVYLTRDDMEITIGIGDSYLIITRDDEAEVVTFDGAAQIRHGRTFLPFRAIAEAFGAEVDYGPKTGKVEWVSFKQKAE